MLSDFKVSTCVESEPEVIRCLRLALTDAVKDIVQQIIFVMSSGRNCETNLNKHSIPECLRESIPKEWNYIPKETKRKESSKGIFLSFLFFLKHIPEEAIFQGMKSSKILKIVRFVNYFSPFSTISMYLGFVIFFTVSLMTKEIRNENDSDGRLYLTTKSEFSVLCCVHVSIHGLVDDCD